LNVREAEEPPVGVTVRVAGLTLAFAIDVLNCTVPTKPLTEANVIGTITELPDLTVAVVVDGVTLKSGTGKAMVNVEDVCDTAKFVSPRYCASMVCVPVEKSALNVSVAAPWSSATGSEVHCMPSNRNSMLPVGTAELALVAEATWTVRLTVWPGTALAGTVNVVVDANKGVDGVMVTTKNSLEPANTASPE